MVGSHTLANVCATTRYGGVVTACGLAGGMDLPATVAPFILRGVTLAGVDSVMCPRPLRLEAWQRLTTDLELNKLGQIAEEIGERDLAVAWLVRSLEGGYSPRSIRREPQLAAVRADPRFQAAERTADTAVR